MADKRTIELMNGVVADAAVFYHKLHHYHWNVDGPGFFTLHELFEKLYDEWTAMMDEVAERVKSLGGVPVPGLAAALELSAIKDETELPSAEVMVERTLADINTQRERMKAVSEHAVKIGDKTTENILDDFIDATAKHVWMLGAYLGKRVEQQ